MQSAERKSLSLFTAKYLFVTGLQGFEGAAGVAPTTAEGVVATVIDCFNVALDKLVKSKYKTISIAVVKLVFFNAGALKHCRRGRSAISRGIYQVIIT